MVCALKVVEKEKLCPSLGHRAVSCIIAPDLINPVKMPVCITAGERVLGLTLRPEKLVKIGAGVPLLFWLIQQCGNGVECSVSYQQISEHLGISKGTAKNWSDELVKQQYITKELCGANGCSIKLNIERIGSTSLFNDAQSAIRNAENIIASLRTIMGSALNDATGGLMKQKEVLS